MANEIKVYHVLTALQQIERWTHEVYTVLQALPPDQVLTLPPPRTVPTELRVPTPLAWGCSVTAPE